MVPPHTSRPRTYLSKAPGVLRRVGDGLVGVRGGLEPLEDVSETCALRPPPYACHGRSADLSTRASAPCSICTSRGNSRTLDLLGRIVAAVANNGGRAMVLVTGVPGAGKTLVGLRFVYERRESEGRGIVLSGNALSFSFFNMSPKQGICSGPARIHPHIWNQRTCPE